MGWNEGRRGGPPLQPGSWHQVWTNNWKWYPGVLHSSVHVQEQTEGWFIKRLEVCSRSFQHCGCTYHAGLPLLSTQQQVQGCGLRPRHCINPGCTARHALWNRAPRIQGSKDRFGLGKDSWWNRILKRSLVFFFMKWRRSYCLWVTGIRWVHVRSVIALKQDPPPPPPPPARPAASLTSHISSSRVIGY